MQIKILSATHKRYPMPEDEMYIPLQVNCYANGHFGDEVEAGGSVLGRYCYDDTGDNISCKNPYYCELTALYWGWKNLDCDYLGLVHYRRYLVGDKKLMDSGDICRTDVENGAEVRTGTKSEEQSEIGFESGSVRSDEPGAGAKAGVKQADARLAGVKRADASPTGVKQAEARLSRVKRADARPTGVKQTDARPTGQEDPAGVTAKLERVLTGEQAQALLESLAKQGVYVVLPVKRNYYIETLFSHYAHSHHEMDLLVTTQVIYQQFSEYAVAFSEVMKRHRSHMFNMCIMRKDILDAYCEWLFAVLAKVEERLDISDYTDFDKRVFGRLSELLLDVWLTHNEIPYYELPMLNLEGENWLKKIPRFIRRKIIPEHEK